jgi:nitrile hydratase
MGGMQGFGPVVAGPNEPVFHAEWEKRVFALTFAMSISARWNIDLMRFVRENRHPAEYLSMSYYQIWFTGLEAMLKERALVTEDEIVAGHAFEEGKSAIRVLTPDGALKMLNRGGPTERDSSKNARFSPGDRVRTRNINPLSHTRLPRYVRGHVGTIARIMGYHVYPDSNATGAGENPQWLYSVHFAGPELWGQETDPSISVYVDAWEPYLEPT